MKVFEYGSGNSTLYWSKKAKLVMAVEHDNSWFKTINYKLRKRINAALIYIKDLNEYVGQISKYKYKFDIIVIDGLFRKECAMAALDKLSDSGVIILDNSELNRDVCLYFRQHGLIQIDFFGFGPINPYSWCTSIFLSKNFRPVFNAKK